MEEVKKPKITGEQYKKFGIALVNQLKNPKKRVVSLEEAAKEARLPVSVDLQEVAASRDLALVMDSVGLTEDFLLEALYDDINEKKGNRVQELKLGFQVRGLLASAQKEDPVSKHADTVNKAMDLMEKLIDKKRVYERDEGTGVYEVTSE